MRRQRTANELRCFCGSKPLLAVYGLDEKSRLYLHIKIFKQERIFGEIVVTEGRVQLHCRNCLRWHRVRIVTNAPVLEEIPDPPEISYPDEMRHA